LGLSLTAAAHAAAVCVNDDLQREVCLEQPAARVISLSPGITELLFEVGAGERIQGTSTYSQYPEAAKQIDEIGSYQRLDMEAITVRRPDLIIAWASGSPSEQVEQLQAMGIPVYWSEIRRLEDIATSLQRFAVLTGQRGKGETLAQRLSERLLALRRRFAKAEPVSVFFQIWDAPLMTVNQEHLISQAITLCGGTNPFASLPRLTPRVDREAVIARDPQVLMTSGPAVGADGLDEWKQYPQMRAVSQQQLIYVPGTLSRATSRSLDAVESMCQALARVRDSSAG
jgi:iron complex transport system substrate-binding protein